MAEQIEPQEIIQEPEVEILEKDTEVTLDVADEECLNRVIQSLTSADKFRREIADPSLGLSYEEIWNEEEMIRLAVSTLSDKDSNLANYYDPELFAAIKRVADRVKTAPFEGTGDDYYAVEAVEDNNQLDKAEAKTAKSILDVHLKKAGFKTWAKQLIWDAAFIDVAIGKIVPDKQTHAIKYRDKAGNIQETEVTDSHIADVNIDIQNFYVENPYEPTIEKNNVTEVYETSISELRRLEEMEIFTNIDDVRPGVLGSQYRIQDNFKKTRREILEKNKEAKTDVLVAEHWGTMLVGDTWTKVNIVLAGDVVIRKRYFPYWHGKTPYRKFCWENIKDCFYGMSLARRFLKPQWGLNQAYNLDIQGSILRASGAMVATNQVGDYLQKQMPDGKIKRGQIFKVQTNKPIRDVLDHLQFPDVHIAATGIQETIKASIKNGVGSPDVLAGKPTGTQLDRTASGYGAAISEAMVGVKEVILDVQDNVISPAIEIHYQLLQQYLDENTTIKDIDKRYVSKEPSEIYGLINVTVYGGSRYLDNERKARDMAQGIEMVKGVPGAAQEIDLVILLSKFFEAKGIEMGDIAKQKNPIQEFVEVAQKLSPDRVLALAQGYVKAVKDKEDTDEFNKQLKAKEQLIHSTNVDTNYQAAIDKQDGQVQSAEVEQRFE